MESKQPVNNWLQQTGGRFKHAACFHRRYSSAERVLRGITTPTEMGIEESLKSLNAHLSSYLNGGQLLFLELEDNIKCNCHGVLDGRLTVGEPAVSIRLRLVQLRPN